MTTDAHLMQLAHSQAKAWLNASPSWAAAYKSARLQFAKAEDRTQQGNWLRICIALEVLDDEEVHRR